MRHMMLMVMVMAMLNGCGVSGPERSLRIEPEAAHWLAVFEIAMAAWADGVPELECDVIIDRHDPNVIIGTQRCPAGTAACAGGGMIMIPEDAGSRMQFLASHELGHWLGHTSHPPDDHYGVMHSDNGQGLDLPNAADFESIRRRLQWQ